MPFHPVPFTIEVRIVGDHGGDPRITTIHYRYPISTPPSFQQLIDTANDVATRIVPLMAAMTTNLTRWTEVKATDINAAGGLSYTLALSPPIAGTTNSETLPGNVQFCIKKATNVAGKHTWGDVFMMDLPESAQNDATANSGYLAQAANLSAQLLLRTPSVSQFPPVVASKKRILFYPIVAFTFNNQLDSLYTRLRGKRRHKRRTTTTTT